MDLNHNILLGLYKLGLTYYQQGFFKKAQRIFIGLAIIDKGATPARFALALMNIEMGDLEEALLNLKALGTDKSDEIKLANALILSIQNDTTSAKEIIKGIDQKNKSDKIKSFCKLLSNEL